MNNRRRATFPARYPGSCLCGATFKKGAQIAWDGKVRRATLCPSCRAPRAVRGPLLPVGNLLVRVDTHPTTGAPAVVAITTAEEFGNAEIYRNTPARGWHCTGGMVLTRSLSSDEVERLIAQHSQALAA